MKPYLKTYRQKNLAILLGFALFLLVGYFLSFRKTFTLYQETSRLEQQLANSEDLPRRLSEAKRVAHRLEETFQQESPERLETQMLSAVTEACSQHRVTLISKERSTRFEEEEATVVTYPYVLEGSFARLVQTLSALKDRLQGSRVMSVRYVQDRDRETRRNYLRAYVYIQQVQINTP